MERARRILILAPHPDDEVVACGIATVRARARGAAVRACFLTTGIPARELLWPWQSRTYDARLRRRRAEAAAAAALLGIETHAFLDIPARCLRLHLGAV